MLYFLLCSVVVLLLLWLLVIFVFPYKYIPFVSNSRLKEIPGPKGYPFIGCLHIFNISSSEFVPLAKKLREKHGSIVKVYGLGRNDVLISDLVGIEKVLSSTRYIKKSHDYAFLKPWLKEGLLTSTGTKWHSRRKMLTPAFHFKILEDHLPIFNRNGAILVEKLRENMDEPFVPINKFTTLCTLDIICEAAMGTIIGAQHHKELEYVAAVQRMSEIFQLRQLTIRLHRTCIYNLCSLGREQKKLLKTLHDFSQKVIKERRAEYKAQKSDPSLAERKATKRQHLAFLDHLILISETEEKLTDLDIQEEVDTFMFEGHDTTSAALSWAIYLLGSHPDIQDKAVEELNSIFGASDRQPTYDDLSQMKYLEQVIKETLRMFPSVPGFGRQLETDIEVMGYHIPAGINVYVSPFLLQRDPELYPDPAKFDPDRFSPEECQKRHPYAFIPFSAGPRSCIGQRFALMEEKAVLSAVLRNFRLESLDHPDEIIPLMELIMRPKDPLRIRLSPR